MDAPCPPCLRGSYSLLAEKLRTAGVIFEADEVHQLGRRLEVLVERNGERVRVCLRIVDGELCFKPTVGDSANALGDRRRLGERTAFTIEPDVVAAEPARFYDLRVALLAAD